MNSTEPVSYTHLDVYKRQRLGLTIEGYHQCRELLARCPPMFTTVVSDGGPKRPSTQTVDAA